MEGGELMVCVRMTERAIESEEQLGAEVSALWQRLLINKVVFPSLQCCSLSKANECNAAVKDQS